MDFKLVIDSNLELVETPIWDARVKGLYWTDLFGGDVHLYDPQSGREEVYPTERMIGSAVPTTDPGKVLCSLEDGLYILDRETGGLTFLVNPEPERDDNRFNDTRVDAVGRVFMSSVSKKYGTPDYSPDMYGGFYMIEKSGQVVTIEAQINQYNAILWSLDNTQMYVVDTYHERLMAYPYSLDQGVTGPGRPVIEFKEQGMPDGMSMDQDGNIYVCHWTGQISVWSPRFELVKIIPVPVEYACCTGFGGEDGRDLYLATSRYCYSSEELKENPGAGGIFVARNSTKGRNDFFYQL